MDVSPMEFEIARVANPVIGKSALPDFALPADQGSEFMRVGPLDELNGSFNRDILRGSQQEMNVIGHDHEGVQRITAFAAISIQSLEE